MEVYTTGGGYFVQDILQFLALYHGSNDFDVLMSIGLLAGILSMAFMLVLGTNFKMVIRTFVVMILVGGIFIGRTASVDVHDKTYGTLSYYATVDNVPYGVALLAHYTTGVSYHVTQRLEQLISTPNDLSYQSNGMVFGASIVAQQARWRAVNNILHERLVEFYQACIVRGINLRYFDMEVFVGATDLAAATAANIPTSLSYFDVGTGAVETCSDGWTAISTDVTDELDEILKKQAASVYERNPGADGAATVSKLSNTLAAMQNKIGMSASTATTTVRQAMLINAFDDSIKRFAAISGNDASLSNLTNSIADIQRRSAYSNVGVAAGKWVPYLKIVFEVIYYGAFPFAVMLMLTPLAFTVMKGYFGGFLWLASWEPISAILHGIVLEAASGFYREAAIQTSDGLPTDVAMTWSNHFGVIAVEQEIGATAGFLMMSVPFLSLAILFGARQMNGLATSMLNVGQGTAIEAGRMAATGQVQLATVGMNTMNANSWLTSARSDAGRASGYMPTGGAYTLNANGAPNFGKGSSLPDVGLSLNADQGIRREVSARASKARNAARTSMSETSNYINEGASTFSSFLKSATSGENNSTTGSRTLSNEQTNTLRQAENTLEQAAKSAGVDSSVILRTGLAASLGLPMAASVGGDAGIQAQSTEVANKTWQAATSKDVQDAISTVERIGKTENWGESSSTGQSSDYGKRFSLDEGRRMASSLANQLRIANDYTRAESKLATKGVVSNQQLTVMAQDALSAQFPNNPQAVERILNARDFDALAAQQGVLEKVVGDILGFYGAGGTPQDQTRGFDSSARYQPESTQSVPNSTGLMTRESRARSDTFATQQNARIEALQDQKKFGEIPARAEHGRINKTVDEDRSQSLGREVYERAEGIREFSQDNSIDWVEDTFGITVPSWLKQTIDVDSRGGYRPKGEAPQVSSPQLTSFARDKVIRTVLGEAGNEGPEGMAAVAHVIQNRVEDPRFPASPDRVALQNKQFSSWNKEADGYVPNNRFNDQSEAYWRAGKIVDQVFSGQIPDNTGGAVNFYAPELMAQHAREGKVASSIPRWYDQATSERDAPNVTIGGHIFTGQKRN